MPRSGFVPAYVFRSGLRDAVMLLCRLFRAIVDQIAPFNVPLRLLRLVPCFSAMRWQPPKEHTLALVRPPVRIQHRPRVLGCRRQRSFLGSFPFFTTPRQSDAKPVGVVIIRMASA